jgi:excisionase family DNA binding protein
MAVDAARETISLEEAAARLGIGRSAAYQHAKDGTFPAPIFRIGRKYLVPIRPLNRLLDGERLNVSGPASTPSLTTTGGTLNALPPTAER